MVYLESYHHEAANLVLANHIDCNLAMSQKSSNSQQLRKHCRIISAEIVVASGKPTL